VPAHDDRPATPAFPEPGGAIRFRGVVAYDGTDFAGWARQPGHRTVQGEIERALRLIAQQPIGVTVAGRTDAGVHARGQQLHFDVPAAAVQRWQRSAAGRGREPLPLGEWVRARLSSVLRRDEDIRVIAVDVAPAGFDSRFSAIWREYTYRVADADAVDPLERRFTWLLPGGAPSRGSLSPDAMNAAVAGLLGLHDWASYCRPNDDGTTVRDLQGFTWRIERPGVLVATVRADAFCHHMVRCLVGAAVAVGEGKLTADDLVAILVRRERRNDYRMAPAHGLVLERVGYPPDAQLAVRAGQTRAKRPPVD
jgi:tRNA pseudouridine38-40 synthase